MNIISLILKYKSSIGLILLVLLQGVNLLFPHLIRVDVYNWLVAILTLIIGEVKARNVILKSVQKIKTNLSWKKSTTWKKPTK